MVILNSCQIVKSGICEIEKSSGEWVIGIEY